MISVSQGISEALAGGIHGGKAWLVVAGAGALWGVGACLTVAFRTALGKSLGGGCEK